MLVRKIISCVGVRLPFSESQKDSMAKKIPVPTIINDLTEYKKLNIDGYPLPPDACCNAIGWGASNKGQIVDYYGRETDIEASTYIFLKDRVDFNEAFVEGRRSFISGFRDIGTGKIPTVWNIDERAMKNHSWSAWIRFRPYDNEGNYILDENDKMIDSILEVKIYNPYSYPIKEYYPKDVLNLYQELLTRTKYFRNNSGLGTSIF